MISGSQVSGVTTISFTRKINTGKSEDLPFIPGAGEPAVILQYATARYDGFSRGGGLYNFVKHNVVGAVSIDFATGASSGELLTSHGTEPGYVLAVIILTLLATLGIMRAVQIATRSPREVGPLLRICAALPRLCGVLQARTLLLGFPFWSLLVLLGYVGLNLALLFALQTRYSRTTQLGYLAAANSAILVLPALRNSILPLVVCVCVCVCVCVGVCGCGCIFKRPLGSLFSITLQSGSGIAHLIVFHRWIARFAIGISVAHTALAILDVS
jgi:hypothetical protein